MIKRLGEVDLACHRLCSDGSHLVVSARLRREKVNYFVLNDRGVDIENNQILATGLEIALLDGNINRQGRCQLREGPADEIWLRAPSLESDRRDRIPGNAADAVDIPPVVGDDVCDPRNRLGHQLCGHHRDLEVRDAKIVGRGGRTFFDRDRVIHR